MKTLKLILASLLVCNIALGSYIIPDHSVTGTKLASSAVDNSTLQYTSNQLSIKAAGVGATQMASNAVATAAIQALAVTPAKLAVPNYSSSNATTSSTSSTSPQDVANTTIAATGGRQVEIGLIGDGTDNQAFIDGTADTAVIYFTVDGTVTQVGQISATGHVPISAARAIQDAPAAGNHTYHVLLKSAGGSSVALNHYKLFVWEH